MRAGARLPRWFIIVRRDRPVLYQHLRDSYEGNDRVEVIVDRRRATPKRDPGRGGVAASPRPAGQPDGRPAPGGGAASAARVPAARLLGHRGVLHGPTGFGCTGVMTPPSGLDEARGDGAAVRGG